MRLDEQREESPQHACAGPPLPCLIREGRPCDRDVVGRDFDERACHVEDAGGDLKKTVGADRKSTRLNSSHSQISYAVFCLKKKKQTTRRALIPRKTPHPVSIDPSYSRLVHLSSS